MELSGVMSSLRVPARPSTGDKLRISGGSIFGGVRLSNLDVNKSINVNESGESIISQDSETSFNLRNE
jgi:hypothetical protein